MSEYIHEHINTAIEQYDSSRFDPDRMKDLFGFLNPKLERTRKGSPFESSEAFTDDDMRALVSLYVLTSEDEEPAKTIDGRVETREEFIARNLLLPILSTGGEHSSSYAGAYKRMLRDVQKRYEAETQNSWRDTMGELTTAYYPGFMSKVAMRLAKRITHEDFLHAPSSDDKGSGKAASGKRKRKQSPERQPLYGTLQPETEDMSEKVKLVRDLYEVAGLDAEEAAKLRQMISGAETLAKLNAATTRALERLRGICYAAAASNKLQMTPNELKRVRALLSIEKPQSLYDQIFAAQRNGEGNTRLIEHELLSGLRKVVDVYTQTREVKPAQDDLVETK